MKKINLKFINDSSRFLATLLGFRWDIDSLTGFNSKIFIFDMHQTFSFEYIINLY